MATPFNTTPPAPPLFIAGHESENSAREDISVGGFGIAIDGVGAALSTPSTTLFIKGHVELNTFAALHVTGSIAVDTTPPVPPLYIKGGGVSNRTGLLYIEGVGDATVNTFAPLFIQVDNGFIDDGTITLYMPNTQVPADVPATGSRTLFIQSEITAMGNVAPLFVEGTGTFNSAPLYIKAPGVLVDAVPFGRGAPLFINRPDESIAMTLFCKALDNPVNSTMSLHTISFLTSLTTPSIPLVIPYVTSVPLNSFVSLYVGGKQLIDTVSEEVSVGGFGVAIDGVGAAFGTDDPLFTHGHGLLNATAPLFVQQNNQLLNTYAPLFTQGVEGIEVVPLTTLVISDVLDISTATIPLYILGW